MSEFSIKLYTRTLYPHDRTTDKQKKKVTWLYTLQILCTTVDDFSDWTEPFAHHPYRVVDFSIQARAKSTRLGEGGELRIGTAAGAPGGQQLRARKRGLLSGRRRHKDRT